MAKRKIISKKSKKVVNKKRHNHLNEVLVVIGLVIIVTILISNVGEPPTETSLGEALSDPVDSSGKANDCVDTDSGFFVETKGKVYGFVNNDLFQSVDRCVDSFILVENVCTGNSEASTTLDCRDFNYDFCVRGACK